MKTKKSKKVSQPQERIVNNEPKMLELFEPGSVAHQGDLIIVSIHKLPKSAKTRKNRQLAEGNTQGSRHVLDRGGVYDSDANEVAELILAATGCRIDARYIGPVFVSPESPTEHDLSHPEHGHLGFEAGAVCATVYQRSLDADEREQRVRD